MAEGEFREFEANNVEEAIKRACEILNQPKENLDIDIITEGSSGFFGIVGGRKAKIRVCVKTPEVTPLDFAKDVLKQMILFMIEEVRIKGSSKGNHILLQVESPDAGLLIGKKGQTLESIQFILNKILDKKFKTHNRVVIDIGGYRERRERALADMAKRLAHKARLQGKPVATTFLSAADRRIIHIALQKENGVRTKSKGDGSMKRVIIIPQGSIVKSRM